jgi:NDP-sugar pyrophosphorylase family protein
MAEDFRPLTEKEIAQLTNQGCTCSDWSKVKVARRFEPSKIRSTHFSGQVCLGIFEKEITFFGGLKRQAGISNATIHNCRIGSNVYINNIRNYIANYVIEDDCVIENVDLLAVESDCSFGNGTKVALLDETGGRETPMYDRLSAQTAYVIAFYRHRPKVVEKLKKMIADYTASVHSSTGFVGKGAKIINSRIIKDVKVGPAAVIEGAIRLENGSINSNEKDPVYIGHGVFAENFICCSGSKITDGAIVCECFVGQGTVLAKQYSAENSMFFANCAGFHGEACAIFAGPYTVTHHKSTLLIAGLFSFLNAGSGSNQSNHMYKLGPVHQGVVERGSKTTSDSYMLWPAKVGAFTVVMGRHYRNSDTSDLPFSYLIEHEDESILVPGVNLRSVGTVRDAKKWPQRDKRKDPDKLDFINFKLLSPYTVQKMLNGLNLLKNLKATSGETADYFTYHNVKIKNSSLNDGIEFYEIGIYKFLGNCLIKKLEGKQFKNLSDLKAALKPETGIGSGRWVDMAGLFAPAESVEEILDRLENSSIDSLEKLADAFRQIHEQYPIYEWAWAASILQSACVGTGKNIDAITAADVIELVNKWKDAVIKLDNKLYADAKKEFSPTAQTGFGLDGDKQTRRLDFAAVRGTFEENSFVKDIEKHIAAKTALANELISRLEKIR